MRFAQKNKKALVIRTASVGVVTMSAVVYQKIKNHELEIVSKYQEDLKTYLDAIQKRTFNLDIINNLIVILDAMKKHKEYEKIKIELTTEDWMCL